MIGLLAVVAIATATAASPLRRTAGQSQPRQTETGLLEHWAAPATLVLDPSLEDLGPGATDAVRGGVGAWIASVPGLPAVTFEAASERVVAGRDGKNTISAAPITLAGHEKDLAFTTAYASHATGAILEADIVFNTNYAYSVIDDVPDCRGHVYDVGSVAAHEAGHLFGLGEDYDDTTTTMYVFTNPCDVHKRALTSVDLSAIAPLYANNNGSSDAMVARCSTSFCGETQRTVGAWWIGLVAFVLLRRRSA